MLCASKYLGRSSHTRAVAGSGLAETEHMFFYPEKDAEKFAVTQFVSADLGQSGLASMVKDSAENAIKVRCTLSVGSRGCPGLKWHGLQRSLQPQVCKPDCSLFVQAQSRLIQSFLFWKC